MILGEELPRFTYNSLVNAYNENSWFEVSDFPFFSSLPLSRDSGKEVGEYETRENLAKENLYSQKEIQMKFMVVRPGISWQLLG